MSSIKNAVDIACDVWRNLATTGHEIDYVARITTDDPDDPDGLFMQSWPGELGIDTFYREHEVVLYAPALKAQLRPNSNRYTMVAEADGGQWWGMFPSISSAVAALARTDVRPRGTITDNETGCEVKLDDDSATMEQSRDPLGRAARLWNRCAVLQRQPNPVL